MDYDETWGLLRHADQRVRLAVPNCWIGWVGWTLADAEPDPDYPLMLIGGQRRDYNANQIIRDPRWRKNHRRRPALDPDDLAAVRRRLRVSWMAVVTPVSRIVVHMEADEGSFGQARRRCPRLRPDLQHAGGTGDGQTQAEPSHGLQRLRPIANPLSQERRRAGRLCQPRPRFAGSTTGSAGISIA